MRLTTLIFGAVVMLAHPVHPAHPARLIAQEPSFRGSSTELVVLPVVVTDNKGRYVSDLTRERFSVSDNGRNVPVEFFSKEDTPVTVGLIIDASGSMRRKIGEVVAATIAFAKSSNPDDELFVIRFNDDVRDAIANRSFLLAADVTDIERTMQSLVPEGRTALYDALLAGFDHLARGTRPRKVLIVISDGGDTASAATLDHVLKRARLSSAAVYTIGLFDDEDAEKNPGVLKTLAHTGGGARFLPRSAGELMQACHKIARDIRGGYTIGYVPPARDGAYHRVQVRIEPRDRRFEVRTRPGYFAGVGPT